MHEKASERVLLVGDDQSLCVSRSLLLRGDGYEVESLTSSAFLQASPTRPFKIAVVCHSVEAERATRIAAVLKQRYPQIRILRMSETGGGRDTNYDEIFEVSGGPGALRDALRALTRTRPANEGGNGDVLH